MNYDKLSRSLRYYYEKGIMQKVKNKGFLKEIYGTHPVVITIVTAFGAIMATHVWLLMTFCCD